MRILLAFIIAVIGCALIHVKDRDTPDLDLAWNIRDWAFGDGAFNEHETNETNRISDADSQQFLSSWWATPIDVIYNLNQAEDDEDDLAAMRHPPITWAEHEWIHLPFVLIAPMAFFWVAANDIFEEMVEMIQFEMPYYIGLVIGYTKLQAYRVWTQLTN